MTVNGLNTQRLLRVDLPHVALNRQMAIVAPVSVAPGRNLEWKARTIGKQ